MSKNPPTTGRQFLLPLADKLIVDLFAGGGGASTGIEQGVGRHVYIAINHSPIAVSQHQANHPQTRHFVSDVFEVDPVTVTNGQRIGLLWASPDCKHFSKAKGSKPVSKKIRGLAWVVVKWVRDLKPLGQHPRIICLENVEEFKTWGPLGADGRPCPERKGMTFDRWVAQLRNLGYVVEWRELRACDYGAPTSRKRFFLVARCDGNPIVWPEATHGKPGSGLKPYRTAADCIDWSHPCPSIFERKKELAPATMRRIAHGIKRYVIDAAKPFIVPITHTVDSRVHSIDEPVRTITTAKRGELAVCAPTLIQTGYGERATQTPRSLDLHKPLGTVVGGGAKHALVAAFMAQHNTDNVGHAMTTPVSTIIGKGCTQGLVVANLIDAGHGESSASGKRWSHGNRSVETPVPTVTASGGGQALVTSNLIKLHGTSNSAATDEPLGTVTAGGGHHAEVQALLIKYYGTDQDPRLEEPLHTITTKGRFALVTVDRIDYYIADIGMRMLQPRELYRAQGFPDTYIIDRGADGVPMTKEMQIRGCGNSVPPALACALARANYTERQALKVAA